MSASTRILVDNGISIVVEESPERDGLVKLRMEFQSNGATYQIEGDLGYNLTMTLVQALISAAKDARP